ncbi:MAG: hypothetical protein IIY99_03485, partial [Firmicutes bacterium]|nr:hypothetical protein [Bacillota bacterium]
GTYGLPDVKDIYFLDCKPDVNERLSVSPDWEKFRMDLREGFRDFDSIALVQINPQLNGGAYERKAEEIIKEELGNMVCVRGYDLYQEVNVQKRGVTALLNARLMPLVMDFFESIEASMKEMGLDLNIYVMKSDGTVMSREYAMRRPVETLLCGPAASVRGAIELTGVSDGLVIDMGGTTSDVALVKNGKPIASGGVRVGQWSTMVKGVDMDTFALGGDTGVLLKDNELVLDERRVIPISILAHDHPEVIKGLEEILRKFFSFPLTDGLFLVLMRTPEDLSGYTAKERDVIRFLSDGPLSYLQLSQRMGISHRFFNLKRLEDEGIIMRSGVTPTDAMHLLGDYDAYSVEAAELGIRYLVTQTRMGEEKVARRIYDLVIERLFNNLTHIEMRNEIGDDYRPEDMKALEKITKMIFERYRSGCSQEYIRPRLISGYELVGVGAPTGIFLRDTADLLETRQITSEYSKVANAVGAAAGDIVTEYTVVIRVQGEEYIMSGGEETKVFESYYEAIEEAKQIAILKAQEKARMQTLEGNLDTSVEINEDKFMLPAGSSVLISTKVTASVQIII